MNFDPKWNPNWTAKTSVLADRWLLDVALPFASFGLTPKEGMNWRMSFMRSGAERRPNSGWPDASVHNPAGFGTLTLVEKVPQQKRVVIYDAGGNSNGLRTELARFGFQPSQVAQDEAELAAALGKGAEAVVFHASGAGMLLSENFITDTLQPFLRNGGLVLVSSYGQWPFEKWFGDEAAVKWSGWELDPTRHTTSQSDGDWISKPHVLKDIVAGGYTPSSGFSPIAEGWEELARQKMQNGEETAYLLRRKIGKGTLILTSSDFGYGGGGEMFGSMNPANAAMLLDNFLSEQQQQ